MNRTAVVAALCASLSGFVCAQQPTGGATEQNGKPAVSAQVAAQQASDAVTNELVARMRAAEAALTTLRLQMTTVTSLPTGLETKIKGTLHVLRGAHPATHTVIEFAFGDGLSGRCEAAQTGEGILMLQSDPVFGDLFLRLDARLVADLEWAGNVLERADLPGMADRRAQAPLGSSMVAQLQRHFVFQAEQRPRHGDAGTWLTGTRKPGLDVSDPDLPVADTVKLFVRAADHALLEVEHLQGDKRLEHLVVEQLQLGLPLPPKTFVVDGRGLRVRDAQDHPPMWDQIEQVLKQADAKAKPGDKRPSQRG